MNPIAAKPIEHLIERDVPLAPRTTFQVGGGAAYFVDAREDATLLDALAWAADRKLQVAVVGGGSNLLVSDRGFPGLVLHIGTRGIERIAAGRKDEIRVRVAAGEPLDALVEHCVRAGWAGLECLSGIPGTVGASPIQNVGAYGREIADALIEVEAIDRATGAVCRFDRGQCAFSYRSSAFKHAMRDRVVVRSVVFELAASGVATVRYPELARWLDERCGGRAASVRDVREAVMATRRSKSMLADPDDPNARSAGSFFVNPVVSFEQAQDIEERARCAPGQGGGGPGAAPTARMPRFPAERGVKLSAAWLVERSGFPKGTAEGSVGISSRHALAIVNRGGATAAEVVRFAGKVRAAVLASFGVALAHEPVLVGFAPEEICGLV